MVTIDGGLTNIQDYIISGDIVINQTGIQGGDILPALAGFINESYYAPYIDEVTGTWFQWDKELGKFIDTGNSVNDFLKKDGSIPLNIGYTPTIPLDIATKEYTDGKVNKAGDTMSGDLEVNGNVKANGYKVGSGTDTKLLTDGGGTKLISDFADSSQGAKADTALQSITKAMVEAVLTGIITSHQHNYTTLTDVSNLINESIGDINTILESI